MKLEELMQNFFNYNKANCPYSNELEYDNDKLRFLDMLLTIACSMKYLNQEDEAPLEIENAHLRGIPITGREVIDALSANAYEKEEDIPYDSIKEVLLEACNYIEERVMQSSISFSSRELADKLKLTQLERFLFLLAYANFQDAKYELLYSFLQGDVRMKLPSLRLGISLYELFGEVAPVEKGRLAEEQGALFEIAIETREMYDNIKLGQTFTLRDSVYSWLLGERNCKIKQLGGTVFCSLTEPIEPIQIRNRECEKIEAITRTMSQMKENDCKVLNVYGQNGIGRRFLIKHALRNLGHSMLLIDVEDALRYSELEELVENIYRECFLNEAILCLKNTEVQDLRTDESSSSKIKQLLSCLKQKFSYFIWVSEEKEELLIEQEIKYVGMELSSLTIKERYGLWQTFSKQYAVSEDVDFQLISNQFLLATKGIKDALWNADLHRMSENRDRIESVDIIRAVRQQSVNQLGRCAHLIPSTYTWADIVLPEEPKRQLQMICNQVKYKNIVGEEWGFYEKTAYGRGVCALLAGAPGTGKTMAVQVIANELGLNLYRIDLSQLISKYIGETEKNISKVFERAKGINALLFFDEADSLFARRLDVRDSMDRSANAQTAHLLQEIEDYDGITILATNLATNIDDAFKRRIKFMVKFSFPEEEVRLKLWKTILPAQVPCEEELDLSFFAHKFELSGSSIKEALTTAAFLAAAEHRSLANRDIVEAIKMNYSKYGKTLTNEEFEYLT